MEAMHDTVEGQIISPTVLGSFQGSRAFSRLLWSVPRRPKGKVRRYESNAADRAQPHVSCSRTGRMGNCTSSLLQIELLMNGAKQVLPPLPREVIHFNNHSTRDIPSGGSFLRVS